MEDNKYTIRCTVLKLNANIKANEVSLLRGAILSLIKGKGDVAFHNHIQEDEYVYSYPQIQYKSLNNSGCILLINEAVAEVGKILSAPAPVILIGKRTEPLFPVSLLCDDCKIGYSEIPAQYVMKNWIPLNGENYHAYTSLNSLTEKVEMLNQILVGNILSCLKGLGVRAEFQISVLIQDMTKHDIYIKGTRFMSFDITFVSNVDLPEFIGLGKASSKGYGVIMKKTYIQ